MAIYKTVYASAPGSIMICGEHAVVYGHPAIVAAIEERISVSIFARKDNKLIIHSQSFIYETEITNLIADERLKFVLACIAKFPFKNGVEIHIESEISSNLGLGSSSAVTIAMLGALLEWHDIQATFYDIHQTALKIIHIIQKRGSGADLAAALWGGMIEYHQTLPIIRYLPLPSSTISLSYCGYKTPTAEVLSLIAQKMKKNPEHFKQLYEKMGKTCELAINHAKNKDWDIFYSQLNRYQSLMDDLGVNDQTLNNMIQKANGLPATLACKISGSGLGDCIVSFSKRPIPHHQTVQIAKKGLIVTCQ